MASPTKIKDELPDILPEDFGEWDDVKSPSTQLARAVGPDRGPAIGVVPKPSMQPAKSNGAVIALGIPARGAAQTVSGIPAAAAGKAGRVLPRPFRANEAGAAELKPRGKSWAVLAGASAALVTLVAATILVLNHRKASPVEAVAAPESEVTLPAQPQSATAQLSLSAPAVTASAQPPAEGGTQNNLNPASVPNQNETGPSQAEAQMMNDQLQAPARIHMAAAPAGQAPPPSGALAEAGMGGSVNNAIGSVFGGAKQPTVQVALPKVVNVSAGVAFGLLIHKTPPIYPQIAKDSRTSGTVVLHAHISKSGTIVDLRVVSGPEMLRAAALDAVRTWRYKPYEVNNQPTEMETTISVSFSLAD